MNPELQRALSLLAQARVAARKDGVTFSPDEEEAFMREETRGQFGLGDIGNASGNAARTNIALAAGQGLTFNWLDELAGVFSPELGEKIRIRNEQFSKANPKIAFGSALAGGIVPGLLTAGASSAGSVGLGAEVLRGAKFGAGAGALAGAGAADEGDKIKGGLVGGTAGATLGGFLPTVVGGVRHFLSPTVKASRLRGELVAGAGGAANIRNRAAELSAVSPGVTAADAAPTLRGAAERMVSEFPALHTDVQNRIAARQAGANERLAQQFGTIRPSEVPAERLARMRADTKTWAASENGFEGLRQQYDELGDPFPFVRYFTQPEIKTLWRQAQKQGLVGVEIPFSSPHTGAPSFAQVHETIQGLDKAITSKFQTPGQKQLAAQMRDVSTFLKAELGRQVPEAAPVFAEYASRMSREKGLALGREMYSATAKKLPDLAVAFRNLAPEAQHEARLALAGELTRRMHTIAKTRSFASLVQKDPLLQEKFAMAFDNPQQFEDFLKTTGLQEELNKLREITANSRTAMRTSQREKGVMEAVGEAIPSGSVLAAGVRIPRAGARAAIKGSEMKAWDTVVRELLTPGMPGVDAFLKAASTRTPNVPYAVQGVVPSIASATAQRIKELFQR